MKRPIVSDPLKFNGAPHIEGPPLTVAEVQDYWRTPGVGAVQARARFPQLSEAELGAAVTYAELQQPEFSFVADHPGPPARRLRLWSEPPGWMFAYTDTDASGVERPGRDYWDDTFSAIIRYPEDYAPRSMIWRDERTGEIVDIYSIDPEAGQTPCSPT